MIITGGKYNGRKITAPNEIITRPTLSKIRMGVFNTLFSLIGNYEGMSFLDMFGGSGIMGIEALSRGFSKVTVFEKNPQAANIIKKNYSALNIEPDLKIGDSLKLIQNLNTTYDVVYVDPPYLSGIYEQVFELLINKAQIIIAEHTEDINPKHVTLIKIKNYGGKLVSFFKCI